MTKYEKLNLRFSLMSTFADECGKTYTSNQMIKFDDSVPPSYDGTVPEDITLKCHETFPVAPILTFTDNCAPAEEVTAIEEAQGGSICNGQTTIRRWKASPDECGNIPDDVTQNITVLDQSPPELPSALSDLTYVCPRDFILEEIESPVATGL